MLKISKLTTIISFLSLFVLSCKKEDAEQATKFALVNVDNATGYQNSNLRLMYNGQPAENQSTVFSDLIKIPAGKGKLSFTDSIGTPVLDTNFIFVADKTVNLVLFQPIYNEKPIVIENKGSDEPQPDAEHIKVKFANFVPKAFSNPFDIIFYDFDPVTFDPIEVGRVDNIANSFPDKFTEVFYKGNSAFLVLALVDHQTQQPLLDDFLIELNNPSQKRILTAYIGEPKDYGSPVTGTPYKIEMKILFAN